MITVRVPMPGPIQSPDERPVLISTRQAADLCRVHVSTIKRWSDAGDLACELTPGGHRRFDLTELLRFAASEVVPTDLDAFGPYAVTVWSASRAALEGDRRLDSIARLWRDWVMRGEGVYLAHSLLLLNRWGIALGTLFDDGLAALMRAIGDDWRAGRLRIGDEHRISEQVIDALHRLRMEYAAPPADAPAAVVAGSPGNLHAVGPFLARVVLESRGWTVRYLGADVPVDELAEQQQVSGADLVCVSFGHPQVPADAVRLSRQLAATADNGSGFKLVMGGAGLNTPAIVDLDIHTETKIEIDAEIDALSALAPPFGLILTSMTAFEAWLDQEFPQPGPQLIATNGSST